MPKVTRPSAKPEQCQIIVSEMQAAKLTSREMEGLPR